MIRAMRTRVTRMAPITAAGVVIGDVSWKGFGWIWVLRIGGLVAARSSSRGFAEGRASRFTVEMGEVGKELRWAQR